jgi:hypothetical protein
MTTKSKPNTLTTEDIALGYSDERWLGWGYLGERDRAADAGIDTRHADEVALRFANANGWNREDLFHWANSKDGRWYGDWAFGCDTTTEPAWLPTLFPRRPAR